MKNKNTLGRALFATALITGMLSTYAATAQADEWHDHGRASHEWHHHYHRHMYNRHRPIIVEQPEIVYAPPLFVQAPDTESSGSFNITIPLNFN
jgi:hypothetical protein